MDILIIEDEEIAYRTLCNMLHKYDQSIIIKGWIKSIDEAIEWLSVHTMPDLIFLDIKLVDGLSFEIFEHIEINVPIIFTTAYHEYAIKAFEVNSIDYLLKPISQENLEKSLQKFKKFHLQKDSGILNKIKEVIGAINQTNEPYKTRFLVKKRDKLFSISTYEIAYFYRDELVYLVTKTDKKHIVNYSLEELEKIIDPQKYFRINRQFFVNISSIEAGHSYYKGKLKIELVPKPDANVDTTISEKKASSFKNWMDGR